jgi:hypothetical protein
MSARFYAPLRIRWRLERQTVIERCVVPLACATELRRLP